MTATGDELLSRIRQAVIEQKVPAAHQEVVIELVARSVITIMSDPAFFGQLRVVLDLQKENQLLRQQLTQMAALNSALKSALKPRGSKQPVYKVPAKTKARKTPPTKAPKVTPKVQVRGSTASNRKAFKEGYRGS